MPRIRQIFFLLWTLLLLLSPSGALAGDFSLERTLRDAFQRSRTQLAQIEAAMLAGTSPQAALTRLKEAGSAIRADHEAYLARLHERGARLDAQGQGRAMTRHAEMEERYRQAVSRYLVVLDALATEQPTLAQVKKLRAILAEILPEPPYRIHGSLPYRHLNLPARKPVTTPAVIPAYQGGSADFAGADQAASPEAPITPAIAGLARSLDWSPVAISEWVRNNVQTEWYWGAMKGAEETLRQKSGNDADQAALLVALLRAAGFPARYVHGVAEFPDIEAAKAQTGLDDPQAIARLFQKAGIPCDAVISGGRISNLRFEHLWVETLVPYANYRGAVLDEQGQTWLALDPSIKTKGYSENSPVPALAGLNLAGVRSDYLAAVQSETPLSFLRSRINKQLALTSPGSSYPDLLRRRTINREEMQILPAGLQFTVVAITGEYAALPDTLLHQVRFVATTSDHRPVFDQTLPVFQLANRSLALTFEPETIEDQEIMNSYGGLDLTPLYLIHLRPVLTVNGKREVVGTLGLTAGAGFTLTTELIAPATSQRVENSLVAGYPTVIGLAAQQAPGLTAVPLAGMNAERLLFERAISYLHQGNQAEEEFASLLQLTLARPLPTLVTVGGVLDVVALLDAPLGFTWRGLYLDADLRAVEVPGGVSPSGSDPALLFMELAGLHHSVLEHQVFAEGFGVDAVSTAKLLGLAHESGLPIQFLYGGNIDSVLPGLNLPPAIAADIANRVHQGSVVTIPTTELSYEDWAGYAYLVENASGSGWMLAGSIAGGMTALNPERWPEEYREILANPTSDFSDNPLAAVELRVIRGPGLLSGTAGAQLPSPLLVVALDREGRRVKGVTVTFTVRAGGGRIRALPTDGWTSRASVTTGQDGRARVELLCPESTTSGNPTTARNPEDMTVQQVDETVIEITSDTGLQTDAPLSVYTFPGPAHHLRVTGGDTTGPILTWGATLVAFMEDKFNNPINKVPVHFSMGAAQPKSGCPSETGDQPGLLIPVDAPCMKTIPVYGECGSEALDAETALHTGAVAQVLLGGLPDAVYPVSISAGDLHQTVTVTANPTGPCDEGDAPYSGLALRMFHTVDNLGHVIDGGPVSKENEPHTIPLLARLFYVREGEEVQQKEYYCSPGTDTCPFVTGNGVYAIDTNFVSAAVSFDGNPATPLGNGLFRVDYPLAKEPQRKQFQIIGEATRKVRVTAQVCDRYKDCILVEEDLPSPQVTVPGLVHAVDITLPKESYILPVNEQGYLTYDTEIPFTIAPPEYTAATSYFVLKKQAGNTFENIAWFNAKPAGQDKMTFLRGFGLDLSGVYKAQVVLNEGSQLMEVRSREMTLQPLAIELDADLNRDGQFSEDDPAEHLAPGLVVPLNRDDDDKDGVPDFIDGYNANGITPDADDAMAEVDDDLIEVKVTGLPATLADGSVTLEILEGAEKIKVWTDRAKAAGSLLLDGPADPFAASKTWVLGSDITTLADLPPSLYIEGVDPSADENDGAILVFNYQTAADPAQIETDRLRVTVLPSAIVPDYNRDGKIDDLDRNRVTEDKRWRFWVNDDDDKDSVPMTGLTTDTMYMIGKNPDDLPGQNEDNDDNQVNGIRDLLDFFPLYLDIRKALAFWPPADGYEYVIKDSALPAEGISGLAMVEGLAGSNVLSADKCDTYLKDPEVAVSFAASAAQPLVPEGVMLSAGFLEQIRSAADKAVILVEGHKPWTGKITLEVRKDGAILHLVSLPLEIVGVEEMFGHRNLRGIAGATDGDPDRYTEIDPKTGKLRVGPDQEIDKQPYCMQGEDKSLVWMHGYNVSPEAARATFAEVFKRFFHTGLTGRFYGVSWFGDPPAAPGGPPHYHQGVVNAFATAESYKNFIDSIPGATSLAAHSLGNIVVGSAIQDEGLTNFNKYFAIDAAVALEAYGQVVDVATMVNPDGTFSEDPNADMIRVENWPSYIAGGQSRLLASEWYDLFPSWDNRSQLTWRNRLNKVPSNNVYNFYSSTEEVLRRYTDDNIVFDDNGWSEEAFATSTWVKQEKFKGRRTKISGLPGFGGVSSNYCGWSFNLPYYLNVNPGDLTPEQLRAHPFFGLDFGAVSAGEPRLADLVSEDPNDTAPSDFVTRRVSETGLANYYTHNVAAHELVQVRDWLLAEAFPATTLPMGANINNIFRDIENQNIDMSATKEDKGCKTREDIWPRTSQFLGNRVWAHSDYKDVPYQHVYEFYNKIRVLSAQ